MINFRIEKHYWYVIAAGIISGAVVFGGQVFQRLGLSLFELSTIPFVIGLLILLPFCLRKDILTIKAGLLPILLLFGFIDAVLVLCQFGAVYLGASVAITVLLLYTQPLWTILFSRIFMKEKITLRNALSCLIVLIGAFILVDPFQGKIGNPLGILVALLGGICLSGWVVLGSYASKKKNNPLNTLLITRLVMLFFLFLAFFLFSSYIADRSIIAFSLALPWQIWIYLAIFGCVAELFNNLFYLKGVQKVPTVNAGIIMLLEPVVGAILAAIFLHQAITLTLITGGVLILFANYLVISNNGEVRT